MRNLVIEPRDALLFRDGKSFAAGLGATSLPFATPSAVAGALRTRLGTTNGIFDTSRIDELLQLDFSGPYLGYRHANQSTEPWELAFAAPADAVAFEKDKVFTTCCLIPKTAWSRNCDMPDGLAPLAFAQTPPEGKPAAKPPAFWTATEMQKWLANESFELKGFPELLRQRRVHVKMQADSQTADEGFLYSTNSLEFTSENGRFDFSLISQFQGPDKLPTIPNLSHLGGEGRTAFWSIDAQVEPLNPPTTPLEKGTHLRIVLATPAVFSNGWKPGWIKAQNTGCPPCAPNLSLKLIAAAVNRAMPLSGWDYKLARPKPTRWLAPAGSVYFFEVVSNQANVGHDGLLLKSICDDDQDNRDGFGRILTGVFNL